MLLKKLITKEETVLRRLKIYSVDYKQKEEDFQLRKALLLGQFNLKPGQQREVDFGITVPADRSLQNYCDILNSDPELNELYSQISTVILEGCGEIFKELLSQDKYVPGYDLEEFIKDPEENASEILELMQGFGGIQHIHFIKGKLALEVPASKFLPRDRQLKRAIKYWLKTVKEFSVWA